MRILSLGLGLAMIAVPALAQVPGAPDLARVQAGTYTADKNHTQVAFTVTHFGFSLYHGLFGDVAGTLMIDPARPAASKVVIDVPVARVLTTSSKLNENLQSSEFLDAAKFPTAHFESTSVTVSGTTAKIAGRLTLHGVTRPVVLDARFVGAGANPMNKAQTIGFDATTTIQRSEFGIAKYVPAVTDAVELRITAAFERQ